MNKVLKKKSIIYKLVLCIIIIFSLISTTGILDGKFVIEIFGMFTTLSNIACLLYFSVDIIYLIKNFDDKEKTKWCPLLKGMFTISITLTFVIAQFVLKMSFSFNSFKEAAFLGLHYIIPIMTLFDWLLFDEKGLIKKYYPLVWLIPPTLYFGVAMISARYGKGLGYFFDSKYPYPFMDIEANGFNKVMITSIIILIGYIFIGYIFYFIDKMLSKLKLSN